MTRGVKIRWYVGVERCCMSFCRSRGMLGGGFLCLLCIVVYLGSVGFVRVWGKVDTGVR